nr:hypothetical protein Z957_p0001 [Clostridium sp. K25]
MKVKMKNRISFWNKILGAILILVGIIPIYLILCIYPFKGFNSFIESLKWAFTESCDKDLHIIGTMCFFTGLIIIINDRIKNNKIKK